MRVAKSLPWARGDFDAAIVDLDGTMVDTLDDFVLALQRTLSDLPPPYAGYTVLRTDVARLVGKGSEHLVKSVLALVGTAQGAMKLEAIEAQAQASYQHHYGVVNGRHARVFEGVLPGLQQLRVLGLRLACVTNKPTAYAQALLRDMGLDSFFELTLGGDAVARKKPDPLPLLTACEVLGTTPQRTLVIGDSSNDAQAARAAGCPVVLVTYGYNHGEPIHAVDADAFTDALSDLAWAG